jgi:SAM-dependent methyltransferase
MVPSNSPPALAVPEITWEVIACPLCGAADEVELLALPGNEEQPAYRVVRCRRCGMAYLNPRPDPASIGQFYPSDYGPYQAPERGRAGMWNKMSQLWKQLRSEGDSLTALPFHGERRLLDYGCGSGWFAERMRERGWNVTAMDVNPEAARRVRERFGLRVVVGALPHPDVEPESYDVITMGGVLEHVHWPHPLIAAQVRALRPGGLLVIVVPNLDSWGFRYFGPNWWPLELPRHLLHFTPATLRHLVESHGLEVQQLRMPARCGWMRRSLAQARRRQGRRLLERLGSVRLVSSVLTRWTVWTRQGDSLLLIARRPAARRQAA